MPSRSFGPGEDGTPCDTGKRRFVRFSFAQVALCFAGLGSLVWFLVRVLPKPSRAGYPCQRAAAPVASAFVLWLLSVAAGVTAWRRGRRWARQARRWRAWVCFGAALAAAFVALVSFPEQPVLAEPTGAHGPLGVGQGIHPGRVVWVHAPDATDWAGYTSPEHWWQTNHTDLAVVEEMMAEALRSLTGESTDAAAWGALFRHFNGQRGRSGQGHTAGEKIAIKINLTACNARGGEVDPVTYEKKASIMNRIDNAPQMLLALLRQLVYVAGVRPDDLSVGDPTGLFPQYLWNFLHPEFPEVRYFDNLGQAGRTRTEFSSTAFGWSTSAANGRLPDYVPVPFAEATYIINFALLKGHSAGITVCAKNHYGSLLRCPDGYLRDVGVQDYYSLHSCLPGTGPAGMGQYRALVDLMGHRELGGKTLLYLVDGLYGGYYWEGRPYLWKMPPFGDGTAGDWPSSLFASQDPVAIDSVAYDFLLTEWPRVVTGGTGATGSLQGGAEDYLHEAAWAENPPSGAVYDPEHDGQRLASLGVHEHWDNAVSKRYSRNLGLDEGIELVAVRVDRQPPRLAVRHDSAGATVSWPSAHAGYQLQGAASLAWPVPWQALTNAPSVIQAQMVVSNLTGGDSRYFRLIK